MIIITEARKYWTEEEIKNKIDESDKALYQCLRILYNQQTDEEKAVGNTQEHNGIGFNAYDAPYLSAMIKSLDKWGHLTNGQKEKTRPLIKKYSKQLAKLANDKKYNKPVFKEEDFYEQKMS